jgi:EAL domain-containing protein (putative c-di-GMP-specific phosphodiesterase class I)
VRNSDSFAEAGDAAAPSRYRLFPDRRALTAEQRSLRRDLTTATAGGHFVLHYQPRMPLRDGRAPVAEALLRWPHRKRGMMSPASFLPMAEQTGQMVEIGGWALRQACQDAMGWPSSAGVAVDISARQLTEGLLAGQVAVALAESGLQPERLELGLAEGLLVDPDIETMLTLSAIRDLGVGLSVDDFGAAHGSLATLKRLPLTAVKIDRSLIRGVPDDAEDTAIVRALIGVGHAVGLVVVAEGVETDRQRDFLIRAGCDEAQGSRIGQPVTADLVAGVVGSGWAARG